MSASRYVKTLCSLKLLQNKVNFELDLNQSVNLHLNCTTFTDYTASRVDQMKQLRSNSEHKMQIVSFKKKQLLVFFGPTYPSHNVASAF